MIKLLILFSVIFLAGCAATSQWGEAKTGGAVYTYQHNKGDESCAISITSAREILGVDVEVQSDCTITTRTTSSGNVNDVINVMGGMLRLIPGAQEPTP